MPLHDIEAEIVLHFFHIYALQNWLADVGIMHFHCEVHQGKIVHGNSFAYTLVEENPLIVS